MIRLLIPLLLTSHFVVAQEKPPPALKLEVKADYLALRITGASNFTAEIWQWRVLPGGAEDMVAWSAFDAPGPDGSFKLATPMPAGGWHRVEVRALDGDKVIKSAGLTHPGPHPFEMVTPERIAALPAEAHAAWTEYVNQSQKNAKQEREALALECRGIRAPVSKAAPLNHAEFELPSKVDAVEGQVGRKLRT